MNRYLAALTAIVLVISTGCSGSSAKKAPPSAATALENGRSIFLTGRDTGGRQIVAQKPPLFSSCAACHKAGGAGGVHLPGGAVSADLRHSALVSGPHPYTQALLERAISTGIDNDGESLNPVMPRWRLSQTDLHDVAAYVYTQLK
jgi:cytochrome c oxidase subunit II